MGWDCRPVPFGPVLSHRFLKDDTRVPSHQFEEWDQDSVIIVPVVSFKGLGVLLIYIYIEIEGNCPPRILDDYYPF